MTVRVVLVTGVPGAGKTTRARQLAPVLDLPLLSHDVIKESLFDSLGVRDRAWSLRLREATNAVIWSLLADCPAGALIDVWLDPSRDHGVAQAGLARAGVRYAVEVHCTIPAEVALDRYAARARPPGHLPADESTLSRIRDAVDLIRPLGVGPSMQVDTTVDVDIAAIADWIRERAGRPG